MILYFVAERADITRMMINLRSHDCNCVNVGKENNYISLVYIEVR
jgi:hypothetical protein